MNDKMLLYTMTQRQPSTCRTAKTMTTGAAKLDPIGANHQILES